MKIKPFKVEQWMNEYENDAVYNIAETCVYSITLNELMDLTGVNREQFWEKLSDQRLTYGHIQGSPDFKKGVAALYKTLKEENILSTHGAIGANHLLLYSLVEPGDRVISVLPTYQQLYSIPESFGADLKILKLREENEYLPDLEELRSLVNSNTKIININNPNNPTGALMPTDMLMKIVEIARSVDAYILCDEVYRGLSQNEEYQESIADLYEKGISVSSMSKIFSLAGLRMGWIASPSREVMEKSSQHRDYNMISCGIFDEAFSALALKHAEIILGKSREIVRRNLEILDRWVEDQPRISYVKPKAGTTALLSYDFDIPSRDFCISLLKEKGVFLTPGSCFEMEKCVRIGYAASTKELKEGLGKMGEFLETLSD